MPGHLVPIFPREAANIPRIGRENRNQVARHRFKFFPPFSSTSHSSFVLASQCMSSLAS